MSFLRRIRISRKIYGGFGLILLLLVAISVTAWVSLTIVNTDFDRYRLIALQTTQAGRVQANVLEARLAVKNFIIRASRENIADVQERAQKALELNTQFLDLISADRRSEVLDKVDRELKAYLNAFAEVTVLQAKRDDLVANQLDRIGPSIENKITAIMESAFKDNEASAAFRAGVVQRSFLLMRLHETKFLITNDNISYERAVFESANMRRNHSQLLLELQDANRIKLAQEVATLLTLHDNALATTQEAIVARNEIIRERLDRLGPQIAEDMEELKLSVRNEQNTLGPHANDTSEHAIIITTTVAIFSVLVGALAAWIIGSGISTPIVSITAAMRALASGDNNVGIPGQDHGDEIGDMAEAVEIFRKNAVEIERLKIDADRTAFVSAGIIGIVESAKDATNMQALGTSACSFLAEYLPAPLLSFYLVEEKGLRLSGGHALSKRRDEYINLGEGLVGQAALGTKIVKISNVPSDSLQISSSLVTSTPAFLYLVPIVSNAQTLGILEICVFDPLSEEALQLLEDTQEAFGSLVQDRLLRDNIQPTFPR